MRLIDADLLQEVLAKEPMENRTYLRANEIVVDMSTAYDVDKVVDKIENKICALGKFDKSQEVVDVAIKELQWVMDVINAELNQ